jgi:ABC-type Mn2+/Zn2+ transport system permease subunit/Mn-dependent DtxR family transcriptional regulator
MTDSIQFILDFLSSELGQRCLFISVLVGIMCGLLGCFIVIRNMSMIGDALSHAILPGIVIAFMFAGYSTLGFFIGSVSAGLLTAFMITWLQQKVRIKNDAAIGIIFTFMFSLGVIGISWLSGQEGVHLDLKDFLFGNLLSVSTEDLFLALTMCLLVISVVLIFYRSLFLTSFQPVLSGTLGINASFIHYVLMFLLSLVVVASLRSVGVILVVSMLITPASAALLLADRLSKVMIWASVLGGLSAVLGLILSIIFDFPVGPSMAVMTTLVYFVIAILAPKRGFLPKWMARKALTKRIIIEDILKRTYKTGMHHAHSLPQLVELTGKNTRVLSKWLKKLVQLGLFTEVAGMYQLTDMGITKANQMIRAHRLWETYLVEELKSDQIHEDAEQIEHYLSEEDMSRLDERLGFPETDPHGSPIPKADTKS